MTETVPAGRFVPAIPSQGMVQVGKEADATENVHDASVEGRISRIYRAMLEAAPALPTAEADELRAARAIIADMVRLADLGFEDSMKEPEENGNFAVYERAKRFLATTPETAKPDTSAADGLRDRIACILLGHDNGVLNTDHDLSVQVFADLKVSNEPAKQGLVAELYTCADAILAALHPAPATVSSGGMVQPVAWVRWNSDRSHSTGVTDIGPKLAGWNDDDHIEALYSASTIEALSKQVADLTKERDENAKAGCHNFEVLEIVFQHLLSKNLDIQTGTGDSPEQSAIAYTSTVDNLLARIASLEELCDKWQETASSLEAALAEQSRRADEALALISDARGEWFHGRSGLHNAGLGRIFQRMTEALAARAARGDDANG